MSFASFGFPPSTVLSSIEQILVEWQKVERERAEWLEERHHYQQQIIALQHRVAILEYGVRHERALRLGEIDSAGHSPSSPTMTAVDEDKENALKKIMLSTQSPTQSSLTKHRVDEKEHMVHSHSHTSSTSDHAASGGGGVTRPTLSSKRKSSASLGYHTLPSRLPAQSLIAPQSLPLWKDYISSDGSVTKLSDVAGHRMRERNKSNLSLSSTRSVNRGSGKSPVTSASSRRSSQNHSRSISPAPSGPSSSNTSLKSPLNLTNNSTSAGGDERVRSPPPHTTDTTTSTATGSPSGSKLHPSLIGSGARNRLSLRKKQLSFSKDVKEVVEEAPAANHLAQTVQPAALTATSSTAPLPPPKATAAETEMAAELVTVPVAATATSSSPPPPPPPPAQATPTPATAAQPALSADSGVSAVSVAAAVVPFKAVKPKVALRNHVDAIRAIIFDQSPPNISNLILGSCSEDGTAKLWNAGLTLAMAARKGIKNSEPFATLRAHHGPVLSLTISSALGVCHTSGVDGWVHCWELPPVDSDPYASTGRYDAGRRDGVHHTAPVWSVVLNTVAAPPVIHCACADGNIYTYDADLHSMAPKHVVEAPVSGARPSSLCLTGDGHLAAGYSSGHVAFIDCNSGNVLDVHYDSDSESDGDGDESSLYVTNVSVGSSPSCVYAAHADHCIRRYDRLSPSNHSADVIRAHSDTVTALAYHPTHQCLASASHDGTVRVWDCTNSHKLLQSLESHQTHRAKWHEAIHCLQWTPASVSNNAPILASAGADGTVKLYA